MKVQAIVSPCPGTAELLILLENYRIDSPMAERTRGRQARGPCTNDDDCGFRQGKSSVEDQFDAGDN